MKENDGCTNTGPVHTEDITAETDTPTSIETKHTRKRCVNCVEKLTKFS